MSKQTAKTIRAALRTELGLTSKQVSVRSHSGSTYSAVDVELKDPTLILDQVAAIAERSESIDRCPQTGEILGGGNTYVSVKWSTEARAERAAGYLEAVKAAVAEVDESEENVAKFVAPGVYVMRDGNAGYQLWIGCQAGMHFNHPETAAALVADAVDCAKEVA